MTQASDNAIGKATFVILDRDGTLIVDRDYLSDPDGIEFLPGAIEGLRLLRDRGCRFVVATNQSGIGRGFFSVDRLGQVHQRLIELLRANGIELDGIYYCPHHPSERCSCRKPHSAMIAQAAAELDFDPAAAVVVGDKESDVEFGRRVGAMTVRIAADARSEAAPTAADFTVGRMDEAAQVIVQHRLGGAPAVTPACI
jgi:D-glycero-D-manno-heptose 1,7-bisphosphate phosphatase